MANPLDFLPKDDPFPIDEDKTPKVTDQDDGSKIIDFDPQPEEDEVPDSDHDDNLAEDMDEGDLSMVASDLIALYDADHKGLDMWREQLEVGLDLLGIKIDEVSEPFEGACGVVYPLIQEALIQFQSRAIAELLPAEGPVKTRILGTSTDDKEQQALRVKEFMNWQITENMEEYFDETDRMLMYVALFGSCLKKIYYDPILGRPVSAMVMPQDFVISYDTTDHRTSGRYTHHFVINDNEMQRRMDAGQYIDVDSPPTNDYSNPDSVKSHIDDMTGRQPQNTVEGDVHNILEMHVDYRMPSYDKDGEAYPPYIVTIDYDNQKVLSIRRNWRENDPLRRRLQWFAHYRYLPGLNFFGLGLVHQLGNLQKSITSSLRIMIDAGQFNTLPAGFKAAGVKFTNADVPLGFGEWRDVQGFGDNIKDSLVPLPTKEPSQTLMMLTNQMVEAGRRLAAIGDMPASTGNETQPVGTMMAVLEQQLRVMSSIHKRLHRAAHDELKILFRINGEYLPQEYPFDVEGGERSVYRDDFDDSIDVIPQSDPTVFSETQRILKNEALLRLAQQFPDDINKNVILHRMLTQLQINKPDEILLGDNDPPLLDAMSEIMNLLRGQPIKAYPEQDHDAHISMITSQILHNPEISQGPMGAMVMPHAISALADHTAHKIRLQIQEAVGIPMPPPPAYNPTNQRLPQQQYLPPMLENEVSRLQAIAGEQLAQLKQQAMMGQQAMAQQQQNPMVAIEQQRLKLEQEKQQQEQQLDQIKAEIESHKAQEESENAQERHDSEMKQKMLDMDKMRLEMHIRALEAEAKLEAMHQKAALMAHDAGTSTAEKHHGMITKQSQSNIGATQAAHGMMLAQKQQEDNSALAKQKAADQKKANKEKPDAEPTN